VTNAMHSYVSNTFRVQLKWANIKTLHLTLFTTTLRSFKVPFAWRNLSETRKSIAAARGGAFSSCTRRNKEFYL